MSATTTKARPVVTFEPDELRAVELAIRSLRQEARSLDVWGAHSTELALAIDDLEELRDRMRAAS